MIDWIEFRSRGNRRYIVPMRSEVKEDESIHIMIDNGDVERTFRRYLPNVAGEVEIDITPYCRALSLEKMNEAFDGGDSMSSFYGRGGCLIAVVYNEGEFVQSYEPFGTWKENVGILTKLPYLQVSKGEDGIDPIIFCAFTWDDGYMTIRCGDNEELIEENVANDSFLLQFREYGDKVTIEDALYAGEIERDEIPVRVIPRGMNTRRLIWRNEMGGYDAWCFEFVREANFMATSNVFYGKDGYTRTNIQSEHQYTIETRELDDRTASVVAYVIASQEVYLWDFNTKTVERIDIVTEQCRTYSDTELSSVQVTYRKRKRS